MHVSDWIRASREAAGLSREQLAGKINCSVSSIGTRESGKREPSTEVMMSLTGMFKMPESLQIKGASFSMQGGVLSVHKGVYTPAVLQKWKAAKK
jgi:ribosome-binding protein aMBF1 (putative translation factor)